MPILHPIDPEVLDKGVPIVAVHAEPQEVERWVRFVRGLTHHRVDWKYRWDVPNVMFLGSDMGRVGALRKLEEYAYCLKGTLAKPTTPPLKDSALALSK